MRASDTCIPAAARSKAQHVQERALEAASKQATERQYGATDGGALSFYSASAPPSAPPSALATNVHWLTELDDTFNTTMGELDGTAPGAAAPAASKLDFLHAQLNSIGRSTPVLDRFVLLGNNQRRQGGVPYAPVHAYLLLRMHVLSIS